MRPLKDLEQAEARRITGLFFDLDDTFLTHGVLERVAYDALWRMHEAGLRLVAVTGRPSGWAEVFVRQWPIDGAVTENGAVFVVREDGGTRFPPTGRGVRVIAADGFAERRARLDQLIVDVKAALPEIALADDNHARRSDVAWDIGERVKLSEEIVAQLARIVTSAGARTTRSTVHLHASFEADDKASGAVRFARDRFGDDPGSSIWRWAFAGDSPNDAACFAALHTTFGVANVRTFVSGMSKPPRWIASAERGAGFAEIAAALLSAR